MGVADTRTNYRPSREGANGGLVSTFLADAVPSGVITMSLSVSVTLSTVSSRARGTVADMQVSPNGSAVRNDRANAASWRSVVADS